MRECEICLRIIAKQNIRYCSDYCRFIGQKRPRRDWFGEPYLFFRDLNKKATSSLKKLGKELNRLHLEDSTVDDVLQKKVADKYGHDWHEDENSEVYKKAFNFYKKLVSKYQDRQIIDRQLEIYRKLLIWEDEIVDSIALTNTSSLGDVDAKKLRRLYSKVAKKYY